MPGMENLAPERTETSSGFSGSPSFWPSRALEFGQRSVLLLEDVIRRLVAVLEVQAASGQSQW